MRIEIRHYAPPDLEACRRLWEELVERHRIIYEDATIGGENPGLEFDDHLARVGADRIWLVEVDGEVAGLTALVVHGEEADVEPVIVTGEMRSRGLGSVLVGHARQQAAALGVRFLNVSPVARNVEAISFFAREGFTLTGHINLFQDLGGEQPRFWRRGLTIHGNELSY